MIRRSLFLLPILAALFFVTACGNNERTLTLGKPEIVSVADLRSFARSNSSPVYWAGNINDFNLELTQSGDKQITIRYLPSKVTAGDRRVNFLTIATYPQPGAFAKLEEKKGNKGAVLQDAPGGGSMLWYKTRPSSVYLAWPGNDQLVEVFWPDGPQALIKSGRVGPVL